MGWIPSRARDTSASRPCHWNQCAADVERGRRGLLERLQQEALCNKGRFLLHYYLELFHRPDFSSKGPKFLANQRFPLPDPCCQLSRSGPPYSRASPILRG